jgi:hypothetical protein
MYDDLVTKFYDPYKAGLHAARFRGILDCLESGELCDFASEMIDGRVDQGVRSYVSERIKNDASLAWNPRHTRLVTSLMQNINEGGFRLSQRKVNVLLILCKVDNMPQKQRSQIVSFLLRSNYKLFRRSAYSLLREQDVINEDRLIVKNWKQHGDSGALLVIINDFPIEFIDKHYDEILLSTVSKEDQTNYGKLERILYAKATMNTERLEALKLRNEITYAYVVATHTRDLSEDYAIDLWLRYKHDDRAAILMKAFALCKLLNVLTNIQVD